MTNYPCRHTPVIVELRNRVRKLKKALRMSRGRERMARTIILTFQKQVAQLKVGDILPKKSGRNSRMDAPSFNDPSFSYNTDTILEALFHSPIEAARPSGPAGPMGSGQGRVVPSPQPISDPG